MTTTSKHADSAPLHYVTISTKALVASLAILATLLFASASPTMAASIGVNFIGGNGNNNANGGTLAPADVAGALTGTFDFTQDNWNNFLATDVINGADSDLDDDSGTATTADIVVSGVNNLWNTGTSTATADGRLMRGYLDTTGSSVTTVTITDIPYDFYRVVAYFDGSANRSGIYTANGTAKIGKVVSTGLPYAFDYGAGGSGGNFLRFATTSGDLTFTATPGGGFGNTRAPLQGIQIVEVVPEPSTFVLAALLSAGALALGGRRRRNRG